MTLNPIIGGIADRNRDRSREKRRQYLERTRAAYGSKTQRSDLGCTNLAHAIAAMPAAEKSILKQGSRPNLAIVSSYNDMLSAHQPFPNSPVPIKHAPFAIGATSQFAEGVPALAPG